MVEKGKVDKWKMKKWYIVVAPKIFNGVPIGETPAVKPNMVEGRTVVITLDKLTGDRKLKHIDVKCRVKEVQGQNANTYLVGHTIKHGYIMRMARRRKSKADVHMTVETKDGRKVRISAVTICGTKAERKNETAIRKIMTEEIREEAKNKNFEDLFESLILGSVSDRIFNRAKDLAPIKKIEVTKTELLEA